MFAIRYDFHFASISWIKLWPFISQPPIKEFWQSSDGDLYGWMGYLRLYYIPTERRCIGMLFDPRLRSSINCKILGNAKQSLTQDCRNQYQYPSIILVGGDKRSLLSATGLCVRHSALKYIPPSALGSHCWAVEARSFELRSYIRSSAIQQEKERSCYTCS